MTDEEMAKEYATKECCTTCANDFCKGKCECWTFAKNGFLAGLKEENAELEEEIKNNEDLATVAYMQGAENQKKKADKQLTKAKEILREYIRINLLSSMERNFDDEVKLFKEAEQFLKEVSE